MRIAGHVVGLSVRLLRFLLGLGWRRQRARTFFRRKLRSMGFEPDAARESAAGFDPLPRLRDLFTGAMGRAGRGMLGLGGGRRPSCPGTRGAEARRGLDEAMTFAD
jgi:hypothetical protein